MNRSAEINELATALAKAQGQMAGAKKDSDNPFFKSKYADLASVVDAIRGPFEENGLSYVQAPCPTEGDWVEVETVLMHASGQWVSSIVEVPVTKQDAQGYGSALTYARRYGLQAIAGVAAEDDDGNAAAKTTPRPGGADLMPARKPSFAPEIVRRARPTQEAPAEVRAPEPEPKAAEKPADAGQSASGSTADTQASGPGTAQGQALQPVQGVAEPPPAPVPTSGLHTFELAGNTYNTKGFTRDQSLLSFKLCPAYDKLRGKGASKALLLKLFAVQSRSELTEAKGAQYIEELEKLLPEMKG